MSGEDHIRLTLRRGFRAYFSACMPTHRALVEVTIDEAQESWRDRRRRRRQNCQSPPPPPKPAKGFFYHFCEGDGLPDCAICFSAIASCQKVISLRCSDTAHHSFHETCISPWLAEKGTCPVCRAKIV